LSTGTQIRCAHCFHPLAVEEAVTAGGDLLCGTCAHLAGVVRKPTATAPPSRRSPAGRSHAEAVAAALPYAPDAHEEFARQVCEAAGVPLAEPEPETVPGLLDAEAAALEDEAPPHPLLGTEGNLIARFLDDIDRWCQGKWWHVRIPVLLFLAYTWSRHAADPTYQSAFKGLNLGIHELGHFVFGFGDVLAAWGGSLLQCLIPLVALGMFLKQRDYFAIAFAGGWLATNFFEVGTYAADAVRMELPLVTPGGGHAIHDWNYILGARGWLRHTDAIADLHRTIGHGCMIIALGLGSWLVVKMFRSAVRDRAGERRPRAAA
jgi:hypothetical protein